jgi:hypothetical protein
MTAPARPRAVVSVSLTDLRNNGARIMDLIESDGRPVFVTRNSRISGVFTPIAGHVESRVLVEMARELGRTTARRRDDGMTRGPLPDNETARDFPAEGGSAPSAGPAGTSLRKRILFWLSGPGVPPRGWTPAVIAQQAGAPVQAVRIELSAMETLALIRRTLLGKREYWSLIQGGRE